MDKTEIAPEVMKSVGELLGDVSDASIKRYAAILRPVRKLEQTLGSLHNEETKRLFVLIARLDKLEDHAKAKAGLAETEEEKKAEIQNAGRYGMYCTLARSMAWCQIHEDIGGFWDDNIGLRENWLVVRLNEDEQDPLNRLKASIEQAFGGQGFLGRIDIQEE